ncbi:MAG TPA: hypothetical protein V6C97_07800, partial [Oculatellaceae cyanobacterium]
MVSEREKDRLVSGRDGGKRLSAVSAKSSVTFVPESVSRVTGREEGGKPEGARRRCVRRANSLGELSVRERERE